MNKDYIESCTMFSTITGSKAYGTDSINSDTDVRGVAIVRDKSYYFGFLNTFSQYEYGDSDTVIYDIRKAFSLISDANPNMLELLFVDDRFHQKTSKYWDIAIENRDRFLSKKVRFTFSGYAYSQIKRIRRARTWLLNPPKKQPVRSDFGLTENKLVSRDDIGAFNWVMSKLLEDSVDNTALSESTKLELKDVNWLGLIQQKGISDEISHQSKLISGASDAWIEAMVKEQSFNKAKKEWESYCNWKNNRNKSRAVLEEKYGYDTKHALHLVRLIRMCKEILQDGNVLVYRPDREELKDIRNGAWTYDMLEEFATSSEADIEKLYITSSLPASPDRPYLDSVCVSIIDSYLSNQK